MKEMNEMKEMRNYFIATLLATVLSLPVMGQDGWKVVHGDCTPAPEGEAFTRGTPRRLPAINKNWDADRIYKQMVILIEFDEKTPDDTSDDTKFTMESPLEYYDKLFNEPDHHERNSNGCIADYFRDQSGGKLNLSFDVYGPVLVNEKAQPYDEPTSKTKNLGQSTLIAATKKVLEANPDVDYSQYDWNGNGSVNQVIYVYAGLPGNISSESCYGHIWPNTSSFTTVNTPDGKKISNYTCSGEHWPLTSKALCGLGTICHEFSHSLGLPDIYPTTDGAGYSVCDEWDLMDGGNFTNYGFCPPNYTPLEKYLLGWADFQELDEATTVKDLKPSADGGEIYRIKHSSSEWYLLENRQQDGWDLGAPGKGLVIYHVNYDGSAWSSNSVNNDRAKRRFKLVHADNKDYDTWDEEIGGVSPYANSGRMNNRHLSTSPYPYVTEEVVNDELTDTSVPAAVMHYPEGTLMGKPITNIVQNEDGTVSFDFMGGTSAIATIKGGESLNDNKVYDLTGQPVNVQRTGQIYIVRQSDGTFRKYVAR